MASILDLLSPELRAKLDALPEPLRQQVVQGADALSAQLGASIASAFLGAFPGGPGGAARGFPPPPPWTAPEAAAKADAQAQRERDAKRLGCAVDASPAEVRKAYHRKARKLHPDRGGSHAAMAELNAARDRMLRGGG